MCLREKEPPLLKLVLNNPNWELIKLALSETAFVQKSDRYDLQEITSNIIRQGLNNPDPEVQKRVINIIDYALEDDRDDLYRMVIEKGLGEQLITPALYLNTDINKEKLSRREFEKTGSETTLIGGDLKDKTIIRHINPEAFLAWQRLFEDYNLWKEEGFDYVPIEPIQSYNLNKKGLVDVYSGVLDLSLQAWFDYEFKLFDDGLELQRDRITNVLDKLNIRHGHTHNGNFCLRFFRDEKGKPDFTRMPRVYLIDFDQAVSPGK